MEATGDIVIKKHDFIKSSKGENPLKYYAFDKDKIVGSGGYGSVVVGVHHDSKEKRAIKIIKKSTVSHSSDFANEIEIMRGMDHPNVIKLYETFEDARNVYLVMEYCEGGELFDRIIAESKFTENEARLYFTQIMQGITYCHANKICHRDLKPENFLLLTKEKTSPIKLIDFGLSKFMTKAKAGKGLKMTTKAGTPYYISPEVLAGDYTEKCDVWSAAVVLYIMLSGYPPFNGRNDVEIIENVKKGSFNFDLPQFKGVSKEAKSLIESILVKEKNRPSAREVLDHPWLKSEIDKPAPIDIDWKHLKSFVNYRKMKKITLSYIATQLNEVEINDLGALFKKMDTNGDGVISFDEFKTALAGKKDVKDQDIKTMMTSLDTDGSGTIEYTEFLAAALDKSIYMKEEKLLQAFKTFDIDGSGKISADELRKILGSEGINDKDQHWEKIIAEADKNKDGEIDYLEFLEAMK